jgi:hypothetical protein
MKFKIITIPERSKTLPTGSAFSGNKKPFQEHSKPIPKKELAVDF